jgi:TolB-like protein
MRRRRHPGARRLGRRLLPLAAAMVMALLGVAAAWWFWPVEPARTNPSIAVLPFTNYGGDEATARLADGITEDIITDLARFRDFDVIARNSTEVYKGKPVDIRQVSQDLGVGYVLEGSIQRQGDRVRVTAQLIDAGTGAHVWSERWDRPTGDVFAVQSELAERVAVRLGGGLRAAAIASNEASRAKRRVPADLTAYDHYLLALEAKVQRTPASLARAMAHLDEALALDPALARGYVARAWLHWFSLDFGAEYDAVIRAMEADVRRAVELDPHDPEARATLAVYYSIVGRWAECEAELTAALEENPANATVLTIVASTLPFLGKPEEGVAYAEKALRLDPRMPRAHLSGVRDTMFFGRRFEEALSILSRMGPENWGRTDFLEAAASYAYLGRTEEAADARARLLSQYPDLSAELLLNEGWAFARQEEQDFFVDAVRRAGLPVCATEERLKGFERPVRLPECLTQ